MDFFSLPLECNETDDENRSSSLRMTSTLAVSRLRKIYKVMKMVNGLVLLKCFPTLIEHSKRFFGQSCTRSLKHFFLNQSALSNIHTHTLVRRYAKETPVS